MNVTPDPPKDGKSPVPLSYQSRTLQHAPLPWPRERLFGMASALVLGVGEIIPLVAAIGAVYDTPMLVSMVSLALGLILSFIGVLKDRRKDLGIVTAVLHIIFGAFIVVGNVLARAVPHGGH